MPICYAIKNWKFYEHHDFKKCRAMSWVKQPNKHDGNGYLELMETNPLHYLAWVLILQVASKCPERGVLKDDRGRILGSKELSRKTSCPATVFDNAFSLLVEVGWLEVHAETPGDSPNLPGVSRIPPGTGQDITGQDRTEDREAKKASPLPVGPSSAVDSTSCAVPPPPAAPPPPRAADVEPGMLFAGAVPPPPPPPPPKPPKPPSVSKEDFIHKWNMLGPPFKTIREFSGVREREFRVRCHETFFIENWEMAMAKMRDSHFCRGGGTSGWVATPEWFLKPGKVSNLVEGNHDGSPSRKSARLITATVQEQADAVAELEHHVIPKPGDPGYIPY